MNDFWKGTFAPTMTKRIVNAELTDLGMNDQGEVYQLVDITFGGSDSRGYAYGAGTYTYAIRKPELDVDLDEYLGDPDAARDDLGYEFYVEDEYRVISEVGEEAYAF